MASHQPPQDVSRLQPFWMGEWLVEPKACLLTREGASIKLRPQLVDLVVCLARRPGEIVLKEEILAEVWSAQFVAESGLSRCIAELRQILQDDPQAPRYIETITKRGYRLVAPVTRVEAAPRPAQTAEAGAAGTATTTATATAPADAEAVPGLAPPADAGPGSGINALAAAAGQGLRWSLRPWTIAAIAALVVVLAAGTWMAVRSRGGGSLTERDPVVLAFENRSGDPVFDDTIPLAVSIQFEQSPYLDIVPASRVHEALQMMRRPIETPVTRAVGLEICERLGARALIVSSVASLGQQYVIGLEAAACNSGRVLARRLVTADRKERVLSALQGAAVDLRQALGEPALSLERFSLPVAEATTVSLEALRALRQGDVERNRGDSAASLSFYRAAVSLDPDFALAHVRRGRAAQSSGTEAEALEAYARAFTLRDRVSVIERLEIEATYHRFVVGDLAQFIRAGQQMRETFPRRAWVRDLLSFGLTEIGRYEEALAEALEAYRLQPGSARHGLGLARSYLCNNRLDQARAVAEAALAAGGANAGGLHLLLLQCAYATRDASLLAREQAWSASNPGAVGGHLFEVEADHAFSQGRLRQALQILGQHEAWAKSVGRPTDATIQRVWMARFEALAGAKESAAARLAAELRTGLPPPVLIEAVRAAMAADDLGLAGRLLDQVEETRAPGVQPDTLFRQVYRAAIATRGSTPTEGFAQLAQFEPFDFAFLFEYVPLFERARAHYAAGHWAAALQAFERMVAKHLPGTEEKLLPLAELGIARSRARLGDAEGSRQAYERLFERWRDADLDLPLLLAAKAEYKGLGR